MSRHFYAFGSICRGEVDRLSDVDLLACVEGDDDALDPERFSIYRHGRLRDLWREGNPFAWHLFLESRLLYSSNGEDFIGALGRPSKYVAAVSDCRKFFDLMETSAEHLERSLVNATFNISCLFLASRNFASCYALSKGVPQFSRRSPLLIDRPLAVEGHVFAFMVRARTLSTRGLGDRLTGEEVAACKGQVPLIREWMASLMSEVDR